MKSLRKFFSIWMIGVMVLGVFNLSGCSLNNKQSSVTKEESSSMKENNKELNEWQKKFLEGQGLPTEYSELNLTQRLSVEAIYEMIMYLEDKYGIGFEYNGYVRPQILEQEHMYAYPEGGDKKTDTFTVTREDDGTLTDDYPNIVVRPYYEQMITDYVKNYFDSDKVRVNASISRSSLESINKDSKNVAVNDIGASTVIFIGNSICSENEINDFATILGQWLQENKLCGVTQLILLSENVEVNNITQENFTDFLSNEKYIDRVNISIQKDQEINIY